MRNEKLDDIKNLANKFRDALELAIEKREKFNNKTLYMFPRGCCGFGNDMLQLYLIDNGYKTKRISGEYWYRGEVQSHEWLKYEKIIIDITGDILDEKNAVMLLGKNVYCGEDDTAYKKFKIMGIDDEINRNFGIGEKIFMDYQKVLKYL